MRKGFMLDAIYFPPWIRAFIISVEALGGGIRTRREGTEPSPSTYIEWA